MEINLNSVSVLMAFYAKERSSYLRASLESIASQTRLPDEIVLVEDGPISSELAEVVSEFASRLNIRSVKLPENRGLARALNEGLLHCAGEFVARMDSDDISLSDRLSEQLKFMIDHPEISVCGTLIEERNEDMSKSLGVRMLPEAHEEILKFSKRRSPISHPAVIYRRDSVLDVGGYPDLYPEDYALWSLMLVNGYKFYNLQQVTVQMRAGDGFVARRGRRFFLGIVKVIGFQYQIGFLTLFEVFVSFLYRVVAHLSPSFIRVLLYRRSRNRN